MIRGRPTAGPLDLTVDGRAVRARPGQTLLDLFREQALGDVPTLCDWPGLPAWGGCGVCAVQVAGQPDPVPACSTQVAAGMVVATGGPAVLAARRAALALLLRAHGGACARSDTGPCALCTLARAHGLEPNPPAPRERDTDESHPLIRHERSGCVLCARCVRACAAAAGPGALALMGRGASARVLPAFGRDLAEGGCDGCGACAEVCPTGAFELRLARAAGATLTGPWLRSSCSFCGQTCPIETAERQDGSVIVRADRGDPEPVPLCRCGRLGPGALRDAPRLPGPLVADCGGQVIVPWQAALERAAAKLAACAGRFGPDALIVALSASLPMEVTWLGHQVAREALGTTQVGSLRVRPREDLSPSLGWTRGTAWLSDLDHADLVLVVGADLGRYPGVAARVRAAQHRGAIVAVIHPDPLDLGAGPVIWLDPRRGTLATLLAALLDLVEPAGAPARTAPGPDAAAATCGLPLDVLADLAARITGAGRLVAVYDLDAPVQDSTGDLALLGQLLARRGDLDHGLLLLREEAGANAAALLGLTTDLGPVLRAGGVRGALVVGEDPLGDPELAPFLRDLHALVVIDAHPSATSRAAHAALPIPAVTEQEGTFLGPDQRLRPLAALPASRVARAPLDVLAALAAALGASVSEPNAETVRADLAVEHGLDPGDLERLRATRAPWPTRLGTPIIPTPTPERPVHPTASRPAHLVRVAEEEIARWAGWRNP